MDRTSHSWHEAECWEHQDEPPAPSWPQPSVPGAVCAAQSRAQATHGITLLLLTPNFCSFMTSPTPSPGTGPTSSQPPPSALAKKSRCDSLRKSLIPGCFPASPVSMVPSEPPLWEAHPPAPGAVGCVAVWHRRIHSPWTPPLWDAQIPGPRGFPSGSPRGHGNSARNNDAGAFQVTKGNIKAPPGTPRAP